jgi:hypothetical protein
MEAAATVAHEQAAGGIGKQFAKRIDAIGQRHGASVAAREPEPDTSISRSD